MINKIFLFVVTAFLLSSCMTKNKVSQLNYMQNVEEIAIEASLKSSVSTIQKGDQMIILITAKDMQVVKPFNQNYTSSDISQYSLPSTNNPTQGQTSDAGPTYIVDSEGNIDFPVLGLLSTTGKTVVEFRDELRERLRKYILNPSVSLRVSNYKITVLGEVNKPGQYTIPDGQSTVLNALGLAGDLTMYGKRNDILLIRNENGILSKERINLMDSNFIHSPYFNLKQGDVIYVSSNETKEKISKLNPNTPIYIAVASIVVTILAVVFRK